MSAFIVSN